MNKELIKNNLLEYAEKFINNGYSDEFVINNFKFTLNRNRIITFFLNDESKKDEINNILSFFIKELKYTPYYFKQILFDQEIKIKLVELCLVRLRVLREKTKLEYIKKLKEKGREYNEKNKEIIKQAKTDSYNKNKDKLKEKAREYYFNNKEKLREKSNEYNKNNKEKIKEYYQKNKDEIAKKRKEFKENYI